MAGKSSTTTSHPCCEKKTIARCIITDLPQQTQPVLCSSRVRSASLLRHRVIRWAVTSVGKKYRKPWLFLGTFLQLQGSFFAHRMARSKNGRPPDSEPAVVCRSEMFWTGSHVWPVAKICLRDLRRHFGTGNGTWSVYVGICWYPFFDGGSIPRFQQLPQIGSMMVASRRAQSKEPVPDGCLLLEKPCEGFWDLSNASADAMRKW